MKKIIFVCLLPLCVSVLWANVKVKDFTFNQTSQSIELILTLDSAYDKAPSLTEDEGYKGVIFPNLKADSKNENFKQTFISQIQVFNVQDKLYVLGIGDSRFMSVNVGRAPNALKITFSRATPPQSELDKLLQTPHNANIPTIEIQNSQSNPAQAALAQTPNPMQSASTQPTSAQTNQNLLPFKNDLSIDTWRYVAVLGVMGVLVLVLWIVKRYVVHKKQFGHYFSTPKKAAFDPTKIEIISQKNLDSKHRILTIESNGYRYLILIGLSGTTLIDRYPIPQSISKEEQLRLDDQFAKLLEQKQERLSQYIHDEK
ncbi:hypothetical protein LS71_001820 [Helicobacter jaachi]|uniref:Uncharacterized protein n=1 Tax=Helicobacter jaachi TaxID=1677920 RepID=A0A4U8TDX0_9HELI|nr:flagellar biosynthetic protein FliO [Helicobacter jaachi]TLD97508.1 hypothetical protein LS71_001820 [Helicobacter jaachi]